MEFTQVVKNRYSCKKFSARAVEPAKLEEILEAGRAAPTAKNLQEQRIYVVQSQAGREMIDRVTPCRYGAPVCVIVAFDTQNMYTYPGGNAPPVWRMLPLWQRICCWQQPMSGWTAAG